MTGAMVGDVFQMVWPERTQVSAAQMLVWANDAYESDELERAPANARDAARLLHDAGIVTLVAAP